MRQRKEQKRKGEGERKSERKIDQGGCGERGKTEETQIDVREKRKGEGERERAKKTGRNVLITENDQIRQRESEKERQRERRKIENKENILSFDCFERKEKGLPEVKGRA